MSLAAYRIYIDLSFNAESTNKIDIKHVDQDLIVN